MKYFYAPPLFSHISGLFIRKAIQYNIFSWKHRGRKPLYPVFREERAYGAAYRLSGAFGHCHPGGSFPSEKRSGDLPCGDSIQRIVAAYGVKEVDVFAVPTTIIVTINPPEGKTLTKTKRIYSRSTDLDRIYRLNDLSFDIVEERPAFDEIERRLKAIVSQPAYPLPVQVFACALAAFGFTLFFGGNLMDALCSLTLGAAIRLIGYGMDLFHTNGFFINTISSAVTAFLAVFWVEIGVASHIDKMVIGAIMNLVPGVAITNSMRDIIAGDLLAGQAKLVEALSSPPPSLSAPVWCSPSIGCFSNQKKGAPLCLSMKSYWLSFMPMWPVWPLP